MTVFRSTLFLGTLLLAAAPHAQPAPDGTVVSRDTMRFSAGAQARFGPFVSARIGLEDAEGAFDRVTVERIVYLSDGLRVTGYLATPRVDVLDAARLPAVVYNRGGTADFGALDSVAVAAVFVPLAARGYVVVGSQYRGNGGSEGRDEYGGADLEDVLNLFNVLDGHPGVDPERIGMVGDSRGGLMTYLTLAHTDRVRAAVVRAGLSDARANVTARPEMETEVLARLVPGWSENREAELDARSPVLWADRLDPTAPLLLLHGTDDARVGAGTALRMVGALLEADHPVRLVLYDGANHGLSPLRGDAFGETVRWLDRHMPSTAP